jgi:hypothetical protein
MKHVVNANLPVVSRIALCALLVATEHAHAQSLSVQRIGWRALQQGGYVIVMRHSSSPRDAPGE